MHIIIHTFYTIKKYSTYLKKVTIFIQGKFSSHKKQNFTFTSKVNSKRNISTIFIECQTRDHRAYSTKLLRVVKELFAFSKCATFYNLLW